MCCSEGTFELHACEQVTKQLMGAATRLYSAVAAAQAQAQAQELAAATPRPFTLRSPSSTAPPTAFYPQVCSFLHDSELKV